MRQRPTVWTLQPVELSDIQAGDYVHLEVIRVPRGFRVIGLDEDRVILESSPLNIPLSDVRSVERYKEPITNRKERQHENDVLET